MIFIKQIVLLYFNTFNKNIIYLIKMNDECNNAIML